MNKKKINFKPKNIKEELEKKIDDWVFEKPIKKVLEDNSLEDSIPLNFQMENKKDYRFTVVIPLYLHRKIKKYCVSQGISIKEKLMQIFEKEFPDT